MTEFELQMAEYQGYLAGLYRMAQNGEDVCASCVSWDSQEWRCRVGGCKKKHIYDRFRKEIDEANPVEIMEVKNIP